MLRFTVAFFLIWELATWSFNRSELVERDQVAAELRTELETKTKELDQMTATAKDLASKLRRIMSNASELEDRLHWVQKTQCGERIER